MHADRSDEPAPCAELASDVEDHLFRTHFERLPGPAYIWQRQGSDFRLVAHNRIGAQIGDSDVGKLIGISVDELYEDRPDIAADIRRCGDEITVVEREIEHRFVSGVVRTMLCTYIPLSADTVVLHARDLTEERATALRLAHSEQRTRALFAANPDIVFRMDADARFIDLHVPDTTTFPWPAEALIGRTVADFYGEEAHRLQVQHNRDALSTGDVQVFEYNLAVGDQTLNLESRVAPSGDNEVLVTVRDVSERVQFERELTVLAERERSRVGREIHDGLAQMLMGARLMLEHVEKRLAEADSEFATEVRQAADLIGDTIAQARDLVRGLSPIPDGTELFTGLDLLAKHSERYLGIRCRTRYTGNANGMTEAAIAHFYRIAQEAITNAVRHGKADAIEIACTVVEDRLILTIADNGCGFPEDADESDGMGLRIMRHRARAIGGDISIQGGAERGTVVTCNSNLPALLA